MATWNVKGVTYCDEISRFSTNLQSFRAIQPLSAYSFGLTAHLLSGVKIWCVAVVSQPDHFIRPEWK